VLEIFAQSFMQRALVAGLIVAMIGPVIGLFVVLRRMAQLGDTLAHVSLAGVAVGLLAKTYPSLTGIGFSVLAGLLMDWLRQSYRRYSELSVAILLSASAGLAVILLSLKGGGANVLEYFWGSMMTVSTADLYLTAGLGFLVVLALVTLYKELLSVTFDEEFAQISGLRVRLVNTIFTVLTATTIALTMRIVGVLLVSSLVVVPVAAALQLARSFQGALALSVSIGVASVLVGLVGAVAYNLAPGGTIVLTAVLILLLILGYKRVRNVE
jgi:zinc transport system permease protein